MNQKSLLPVILLVFLIHTILPAQKSISAKKSFHITNGKIKIKIIYPVTRGLKPTTKNKKKYSTNDNSTEVIVDILGGSDNKLVTIGNKKATLYSDGHFYANIGLKTGENKIKIIAEDHKGNKADTTIKVISSYQHEINIKDGNFCALIIGVNDYIDESLSDLSRPIDDAKKLKELLTTNYSFKNENIIILENPKRKELLKAFENLTQTITSNDNLLIFYAGHGLWNEEKKTGYWLPSDAEALNSDNWFRNSTVKDFINSINSKHTLLITDACFGGSIFQTRSAHSGGISAYNKLYELPSRKGMTSGTLKRVPDNSVFIKYLFKRLEQNEEKYLPASTLFNSLRDAVLNNSPNVPQYGVIQNVGDEGGEFIFIRE